MKNVECANSSRIKNNSKGDNKEVQTNNTYDALTNKIEERESCKKGKIQHEECQNPHQYQ